MSEFKDNLGYRVTICLKFKKKGEGEEGVKGRGGERGEGRRKRKGREGKGRRRKKGRERTWEEKGSKIGHWSGFSNRMALPVYEQEQHRGCFGSIRHPHKGQLDKYHHQSLFSQTFAISLETSNT